MNLVRLKDVVKLSSGSAISNNAINKNPLEYRTKVYGANGVIGSTGSMANAKRCVLVGRVGSAGETNICKDELYATDNLLTLTPQNGANIDYLYYAVSSLDKEDIISRTANPLLTGSALKLKKINLPSVEVQEAISSDLMNKEKVIESKIEALTQKLHQLEEYKTALIHNAVTKGLNANGKRILDGTPAAEMKWKDSGVEWIGEIPDGWGFSKLKANITQKITDGPHETPSFIDDGVEFLSVDGIQDNKLVFNGKRYISHEDHARYQKKAKVETGDLLLGKAASVGKVAMVGDFTDFSIWSPLALIKPKRNELVPEFLYYLFQSELVKKQIIDLSTFNTQQNISMRDLHEISYYLPTLTEQSFITRFLAIKSGSIEMAKVKIIKKIALLLEYKKSLINEAVSGQ
ncbi:TPA: restriction endonuclease subunit S [Vibrio antiquarius]